MPLPFELALGVIAAITIVALFVNNRSSEKMIGTKATIDREAQMAMLYELQSIAKKLEENPESPEAPVLRKQLTELRATYMQEANKSLANTKAALKPMIVMKFIMGGLAALFALGAIGYLILTQGGPIFIGAGILILIMLVFSALQTRRWWRNWKLINKNSEIH